MKTSPRSYPVLCACACIHNSGSMRERLSSIHYKRPRLIMLCASALAVLLWSAAPARAAAFDDQTASLFPAPPAMTLGGWAANWGDYNNDGYVDLNVGGRLWKNNGGASFTFAHWLSSGPWGDYNNDGWLDSYGYSGNTLYRNQSTTTTTSFDQPITMPALPMAVSRGASWADYNGNGYLDLYVGGYESPGYQPDAILRNNQGVSFTKTWQQSGDVDPARGITSCDFDRDGDQDVYVSNYRLEANLLQRNDGTGSFTNVAPSYGVAGDYDGWSYSYGHTIGSAWGDLDNDGNIDLFVGNFSHPDAWQDRPKFYKNLGAAGDYHFEDKSGVAGLAWQESYASPALGDYDNDGDLDLFFTTVYGGDNPVLYRNDGNWNFTNVTAAEGLTGIGATYQAAWADIDKDGDLDLVTGAKMFVNNVADPDVGNSNHWLRVHLNGDGTTVNGAAIGSQVRITVGGKTLTRQVEGGTGEGNQNDPTLHFGLGDHSGTVDLVISAPDGTETTVTGVAVNQTVQYVVYSRSAANLPTLEVFRAGFETSEGYSSAAGGEYDLAPGYIGDASNQQGWYSETYYNESGAPDSAFVSTANPRSGSQSLRLPKTDYFYDHIRRQIPERTSGTLIVEMWYYLEHVSTAAEPPATHPGETTNNIYMVLEDRFDTSGDEYAYSGPGGHFTAHTAIGAGVDATSQDSLWGDSEYTATAAGAAGVWRGLKAMINLDAGKFDLYVDTGSGWIPIARNEPLSELSTDPHPIDIFTIYQFSDYALDGSPYPYFWGDTDTYVDDILISWAGPGIFGDADDDWLIDSADLAIWQQHYDPLGLNDNTFAMGDWNCDGLIDSADLALWQQNYDPIGPGGLGAAHTPEPATLFVMAAAGLPLLLKRKRKSRTCFGAEAPAEPGPKSRARLGTEIPLASGLRRKSPACLGALYPAAALFPLPCARG